MEMAMMPKKGRKKEGWGKFRRFYGSTNGPTRYTDFAVHVHSPYVARFWEKNCS